MTNGYALFDTALGHCAIAWGPGGITCVQLPEGSDALTRARIMARAAEPPEAIPPPPVKRAIAALTALIDGGESELTSVRLDMDRVPPFHRKVYEVARTIPRGETLSYGAVAERLGSPGSARAVGQALGRNPFALVVPCHRVLASGGKVGGFTANGGVTTKLRLLAIERGDTNVASTLFRGRAGLDFDPEQAVRHLRECDPDLGRLIDAVGAFGMQRDPTSTLFVALAQAIVYQQLNGKAASTIFARVRALFGDSGDGFTPERVLRASDEKLRGAGLSRSKLLSIRDLAAKAKGREIPTLDEVHSMDDEAIIERLTVVRGIGRWTVEMFLMFRLGRADVLPVDDYGIRKGFAVAFKKRALPDAKVLAKRGAKWKPYRSVASWYLWRAAERATERASR